MRHIGPLILSIALVGCQTTRSRSSTSFTSWPDERSEEAACQHYAVNVMGKGYRCERQTGSSGLLQLVVTGPYGATRVPSQFDLARSKDESCCARKTAVYDSVNRGYALSPKDARKLMSQNCNTTSVVQQWQEAAGVAISITSWRPRRTVGSVYTINRNGDRIALPATNETTRKGLATASIGRRHPGPTGSVVDMTDNVTFTPQEINAATRELQAHYCSPRSLDPVEQVIGVDSYEQIEIYGKTIHRSLFCERGDKEIAAASIRAKQGVEIRRERLPQRVGKITVTMEDIE